MRRIYARIVALLLAVCICFCFCACSGKGDDLAPTDITQKLCDIDSEIAYVRIVPEQIPSFFNISVSAVKNYSVFIADNENLSNTVAVFELYDETDKSVVLDAINTYISSLSKTFELSNANEFKKLASRKVLELNDSIILIVSDNVTAMQTELEEMGAKALK